MYGCHYRFELLTKENPEPMLTPKRQRIGKAVARKIIAAEALKDPKTKCYLVEMIGRELATRALFNSLHSHSQPRDQRPSFTDR